MKTNFYITLIFILLNINSNAQTKRGIINYEISVNTEELIDGLKNKNYPKEHKEFIANSFINSKNINYQLHFNNKNSIFFYVKELQLEDELDFNFTLSLFGESTFYKNIKSKKTLKDDSYLENKLIEYPILEWEITAKTKKIGNYTCYMASTFEELKRDGNVNKTEVIVWFTPDISTSFGPKNYNGLPGLVLEVNIGIVTIKATEIKLNTNELNITLPKGEIISYDEAELIYKEMLGNRRKMK